MDVLKCEAFLAAVERGSIFAASNKLHYTPSGVNRMISALEDELNVTLLIRSRTGVTLTEIGEHLLPVIKQFVDCSARIHEICKEGRNYIHEVITIGAYHSITENKLPSILNKFKSQYPSVQVNVVEGPPSMLLPMLKEHDVDCCIVCDPNDNDVMFEPLYSEQILVLQPSDQKITDQPYLPINDLGKHPFICFGSRATELEKILKEHRIKLDIRFTTRSIHTMYKMVEEGLGIAVNIESCIKNQSETVSALPLNPPAFTEIGVAFLKDGVRPIVQRFINLIIATLGTAETV